MCRKVAQIQYSTLGCFSFFLGGLALVVMLVAGVWAYFISTEREIPAIIGLCGLVILLLAGMLAVRRWRLVAKYDPNEHDLYNRKVAAGTWAKSLEDFDAYQASLVRDEYKKHAQRSGRKRRRHNDEQPGKPSEDDFTVTWWVVPSMFLNGGLITIPLIESAHLSVEVPDSVKPGDVLSLQHCPDGIIPFKVRVLPIYSHIDEQRLE